MSGNTTFKNTFGDKFGDTFVDIFRKMFEGFGTKQPTFSKEVKESIDLKYKLKKAISPYKLYIMKSGTYKILTPDFIEVYSCECEYTAKKKFIEL